MLLLLPFASSDHPPSLAASAFPIDGAFSQFVSASPESAFFHRSQLFPSSRTNWRSSEVNLYDIVLGKSLGMEQSDFYEILGLRKNCTTSDVRNAYKRLAMRWHPDKCSAVGTAASDQAKKRFQAIQEAYSVLSDDCQRFWCDAGLYDRLGEEDETEGYGMDDFMGEMATLMTENKPKPNGTDNFEELKEFFMKMLEADNCTPTYNQKLDLKDNSSTMSCMGEHFQYTGIPTSQAASGVSQTSGFCMGACSGSPSDVRKGKRKGTG